jgi:hypothetical protein
LYQLGREHRWEDCGLGQPEHKYETLFNKKLQQKWAVGVGQVVEPLISKCKALSSNLILLKEEKKQINQQKQYNT